MADEHAPVGQPATRGYDQLQLEDEEGRFYARLAEDIAARTTVEAFVIPARTGKGFVVEKGRILRLACHEDSQVADLDVFNRDNTKEQFSSSKTRIIHGCHLTTGHRLWSHPIYQRPMMTIIADTVDHRKRPDGAVSHDLLYGMCDERLHFRLTGKPGLANCRDNLTGAVAAFGLTPEDVHDPLNVFMTTGIGDEGRLFFVPPEARRGDYMEFYAEMDTICAISACPGTSSGPNPGGLRIEILETSVVR
jgi:uncharacterized protein YcgI (DUF1989 family)